MSFNTIKRTSGRKECVIFEIDLDINDPTFNAEFAADPASYGTPKTTNDVRAWKDNTVRTYRYSNQRISNLDCFPGLIDASSGAPKANPGINIGDRATANIRLTDFESNDAFELQPPYDDRRVTGSHWAKLFARNYVKNRPARIRRGYLTDDGLYLADNFQAEHYIVDKHQGPKLGGEVDFNLVDVLALTNGINAKAPETSNATLNVGIDTIDTAITVNLESGLSATQIEAKFGANGATGFIAIGDEYLGYTVTSATGAAPVTMNVTRGQYGTLGAAHEINATVQKAIAYDLVNVMVIIEDLIRSHTDIDQTYIPAADWAALAAGDLSLFTLKNIIAKETEVKKMLNELIQIAGLTMYVDVVKREITVTATPNFDDPVIVLDSVEHFEHGTFNVENDFSRLVTRQLVTWAPKDYSKTEESNYTKTFRVAALLEELPSRLGTKNEGKTVVSKWMPNTVNGNQIATGIAQRNVARFSQVPQKVIFEIDSRYIGDLENSKRMWVGSVFQVITPEKVFCNGAFGSKVLTCQCTSVVAARKADKWKVEGISYQANIPPNADYYISSGEYLDYVLADNFGFTEAREYIVVINSGAVFGSTIDGQAAFRQGVFPVGATLKIIIQGQIVGKGGAGGAGSETTYDTETASCVSTIPPKAGDGSPAAEFTTAVVIDNSFGLIAGGGGGSQGTFGSCDGAIAIGGNGGGGGQGFSGGAGGAAGVGVAGVNGNTGSSGNINYPGQLYRPGGELGQDGFAETAYPDRKGLAGAAIITNGNTVTITAGNNAEQIKGAIV